MNKQIIKYLQGNEGANNLGTILGIQKWKHSPSAKLNSIPTAVLFYLDQRTGRIERYLVNSIDQQPVKILLDHEKYHITEDKYSFKKLNYGKLDSTFFNGFLLELFRDYLQTFHSYKICDMNYIRNYTLPLYTQNGSNGSVGLGSGVSIPNTRPLTGTKVFYAKRFFELSDNIPHVLNIPPFLNSYNNKGSLETLWNIKLNPYVIDFRSPQSLTEFKVNFNSRKILGLESLNDQVIDFNNRSYEKLVELEGSETS